MKDKPPRRAGSEDERRLRHPAPLVKDRVSKNVCREARGGALTRSSCAPSL